MNNAQHTPAPRVFLFLAQPAGAPAGRPWALVWAEYSDSSTYTRAEQDVYYKSKYAAQSAGLAKFHELAYIFTGPGVDSETVHNTGEPTVSTNHTQTFVVVLRRTAAQPIQPQTLARELAAFLHAGSGTLLPAEAVGVDVQSATEGGLTFQCEPLATAFLHRD